MLTGIAVVVVAGALALRTAFAAGTMSITGYAWSPNIGWVSFSGTGYGVTEDTTSGALSGYAWSSNIGWISFQWSDASHPAPVINLSTGKASGWARACAAFLDKNACSGALDGNSGGWDGWISLAGTAADNTTYAVSQSLTPSCAWSGYAWGGNDLVGAISMSGTAGDGSTYGVAGTNPAACGQVAVSCSVSPTSAYTGQTVTWSSTLTGGSGPFTYSWSGTDGLSGSGSSASIAYTTSGTKTATVQVTDTGTGNTASATCSNSSTGQQNVVISSCTSTLSANPNPVEQGQNTTLTWSTTGGAVCATTCSGSGFSTGGATSGSALATVPPAPPTTSYALTCSGGSVLPPPPANVVVSVIVPAVTSFTVNGQSTSARVVLGQSNNANLAWSSQNASSCSVTKNGTAWLSGLSNAGALDTVTTRTVYLLDCQNSQGTHATSTVIVNAPPGFQEF